MSRGISLERFDSMHLLSHARAFALPNFLKNETVIEDTDEPEPELSEVEKATAAIEAERAEKERMVSRFEVLMTQIEQNWVREVDAEVRRLAERSSESVDKLLPGLLSEFGAAQIASAVIAVVETADVQAPLLHLSPEDYAEVVAALSDAGTHTRIEIRESSEQPAGTAALRWDQGGADLDLKDFLSSARQALQPQVGPRQMENHSDE